MMPYAQWEMQKFTVLVLIDLLAAFDIVDHQILLEILSKKFGMAETMMDWFTSYLCDHKCKVCVGKEYSDIKIFKFSVPHGGILSPTLLTVIQVQYHPWY